MEGMRPTRDILYVAGRIITDDTLHIFVVHAPSRYGGEKPTRPHRRLIAKTLCGAIDSIRLASSDPNIIIAGALMTMLTARHLCNCSFME